MCVILIVDNMMCQLEGSVFDCLLQHIEPVYLDFNVCVHCSGFLLVAVYTLRARSVTPLHAVIVMTL